MMIIKALVLVVVLVAFAANVNTTPIKRNLIVFGDSISDSGNSKVNGWPQLPYYNGRYTNGKTWNEFLPSLTGMRMINYAFAAATSDTDLSQGFTHGEAFAYRIPAPGVKQLITRFLAEHWMSDADITDSCVVIWLNGVNYLGNPFNTGQQVAQSIFADADMLYDAGFRCFFFGDMIDPSQFPKYGTLPFPVQLFIYGKYLLDHVPAYNTAYNDWVQKRSDCTVIRYDPNGDFKTILDPSTDPLHLADRTNPCTHEALQMNQAIAQCDDPYGFAFWDPLHPTTRVHEFLSGNIAKKLIQ